GHRAVRGREHHGVLAPVEACELALELHVRRVGPGDEAHRARAHAVGAHRLLLRADQLRPQAHPQVRVRVHTDELAVALALEQEARAAPVARGHDAHDDLLGALRGAGALELLHVLAEAGGKTVDRHLAIPQLAPTWRSMSSVMAAAS